MKSMNNRKRELLIGLGVTATASAILLLTLIKTSEAREPVAPEIYFTGEVGVMGSRSFPEHTQKAIDAIKKGLAIKKRTGRAYPFSASVALNPGTLKRGHIFIAVGQSFPSQRPSVKKINASTWQVTLKYHGEMVRFFIVENGRGHS